MDPQAEREALRALLDSDGWRLFNERIEAEWGAEAVCRANDALYAKEDETGRDQEHERRALALTTRKVQALRRWPEERIAALRVMTKPSLNPFATRRRA